MKGEGMKSVFLTISLLLMISLSLQAQQTSQVNLSLIELKFRIIFANRDMFLRPCLVAESYCKFNSSESKLGIDIVNSSASYAGIDFQSSSQNPQLFLKDIKGIYQVVSSDNQRGAMIHVNVDRLLEPMVRLVGIDKVIGYVVSVLFFQMTNNWEQSMQSGAKVAAFWSTKFKSFIPLLFNEESVEVSVFKNKEVRIMLYDNFQSFLISLDILKRLPCANGFLPAILVDSANEKWADYQYKNSYTQGKFVTDLTYQCVDAGGRAEKWSATVSFDVQFEITALGQKQFAPKNFRIDVLKSQKIN